MNYSHLAVVETLMWKIDNLARCVVLTAVSMNISGHCAVLLTGTSIPLVSICQPLQHHSKECKTVKKKSAIETNRFISLDDLLTVHLQLDAQNSYLFTYNTVINP